jgi:hypothetical protein
MKHKKILTTLAAVTLLLSVAGSTTVPVFAAGFHHTHDFWHDLTQKYGKVEVDQAQVTGISGTTLTVSKNGTTYIVNTMSNTIFYRQYFGVGTLAQVNIGDYVNVRGTASGTTIAADFVRDTSIREYKDTFDGHVTQITSNGFVFASDHRGSQTVTVDGNAKLTDKNGNTILLSQIQVNDHLVLDGIWDHTQNMINFVDYVHDYSLPQ